MRISKEISGNAVRRDDPLRQGRGEFEWCDFGPDDPKPDQIVDKQIVLELTEGILITTGCIFKQQAENRESEH